MDFTTIGDNNCVSYSNRAAITSSQQHLFCYRERIVGGQTARPCAPVILEPVILDSRENSHAIPNKRFALMVGAVSVIDKNEMPFSIKKQQTEYVCIFFVLKEIHYCGQTSNLSGYLFFRSDSVSARVFSKGLN